MTQELIEIKNLSFKYNDENTDITLNNINLTVKKGEWISIVGHNGSGKSTLAKFLNGLLVPMREKQVLIEGFDPYYVNQIWEVRKKVGMVFQNPENQMVATTVKDDIAFGLENIGINRDEMLRRIAWAVERVGMSNYLDTEPYRLSGGQKQRVAIAGIIAMKPSVIILDEATSMLDPRGRDEIIETVRELCLSEEITVINITHDLEETIFSDRIVILNKGSVVAQGTPQEVFQQRALIREVGLDLPFALQMQEGLENNGLILTTVCLTKEELVDELWKLKLKI